MTANPTDIFKAVATPPPELQQMLAYHADNGSVLTGVKPRPVKDQQKDANRDDMASNIVMQHLSEQERIYQEYREQSERINQATELALADAATPEERQEILEYQAFVQEIDEDIEQKREAGTLTDDDLELAEQQKIESMPESVKKHLPEGASSPVLDDAELSDLEARSTSSFATSSDSSLNSPSEMNLSFQQASAGEIEIDNEPTAPDNIPVSPSDFPKFTG